MMGIDLIGEAMDAHDELLNRWSAESRHVGKGFIRDGIIDPDRWAACPRKVLLLLKEAYESEAEKKGYDLCKLIRDEWEGPKHNIWWNASYWCLAAQSIEFPPPLPSDDKGYVDATKALLASSVVNVKKSDGRSFSDNVNLKEYTTNDKEYIKKQIKLIDPQIVICGNTWSFVEGFWPSAKLVSDLVYVVDGRIFIDYWHPANQYPHKLNYYAFAFILQQAYRAKPEFFS
jgi:hypothetical protein